VSPKRKTPPVPPQAEPATRGTLPMQLHLGDRFIDEEGEWEIAGRPWTTHGGKLVHATIEKPGDPSTKRDKTWGAHERGSMRRVKL
jgi:hypothetical protein